MISRMTDRGSRQYGAVSIFIVIITALLFSVVTISFVRIMLRDYNQASSADLSQSAYDAATSGLEDSKRALLQYYRSCALDPSSADCLNSRALLEGEECGAVAGVLYGNPDVEETLVETNTENDSKLDQAYTCAIVRLNTDDYLGVLSSDASELIELNGTGSFNRIMIEWSNSSDLSGGNDSFDVSTDTNLPLPNRSQWPSSSPALMRAQLIQPDTVGGFVVQDFDANSNNSYAHTLFLYPQSVAPDTTDFSLDMRRDSSLNGALVGAPCQADPSSDITWGNYSCKLLINLPALVSSPGASAYIRLTSLYNGAHYRVKMYNGDTLVQFHEVQPEVDVTGRTADLFRRVRARVTLNNFSYPEATIDVSGNLCKDFTITDSIDHFQDRCQP